jgi:hypothetical protein
VLDRRILSPVPSVPPKVLIAVPVVVAAFFPFMAPPKKKESILKLKRLP